MMFSMTATTALLMLGIALMFSLLPQPTRMAAEKLPVCRDRAACPYAKQCDGKHCRWN